MNLKNRFAACCALVIVILCLGCASAPTKGGLPLVFSDDFSRGMNAWKTTDPDPAKPFWKIENTDRGPALRVTGKSNYKPPVRSPHSIALVKDVVVGDFILTATVQNTNVKAGAHRDLCLFWGYQDPSHFYYVHYGAKADPHACQIFIVDGAPRIKITTQGSQTTPWTEGWHNLKVERNVADGTMKVYFDDMEKPHMIAKDTKFTWGQVGVGTFDDNGNFDDVQLFGNLVTPQ